MAETKPDSKDKVGPVKYLGQVRQEGRKVVWPTRQETVTTTILVMIMVLIMGAFFFVVDQVVRFGIRIVVGLFGGAA
ncbi:MAG: preprotein translocase subunit SecE [Hellea sp.]|nr:preprotein translocase subunit SecE [Hellea sp.]